MTKAEAYPLMLTEYPDILTAEQTAKILGIGRLTMEERQRGASVPLGEYMLKFVERKKGSIAPMTYVSYTNMVKGRIHKFFDPLGVTISTLTPQLIEDFLDSIADDGYNGSTQLRYYQIIGACMKNALRKDHIDRNPMDKVDRPKKAKEPLIQSRCADWRADFLPGKPKTRRNTDVFQGFLAMSRRKICRQDVRWD